jgi:hypothetical protein
VSRPPAHYREPRRCEVCGAWFDRYIVSNGAQRRVPNKRTCKPRCAELLHLRRMSRWRKAHPQYVPPIFTARQPKPNAKPEPEYAVPRPQSRWTWAALQREMR